MGTRCGSRRRLPQSPISPRPIRDGAAGLGVGIVLGLIFAVVADRVDRRLEEQADFEGNSACQSWRYPKHWEEVETRSPER